MNNNLVDEYLSSLNINSYLDRQLIKQSILEYLEFYNANQTCCFLKVMFSQRKLTVLGLPVFRNI